LKEIFEQSESIGNTLRGRIDYEKFQVNLGGIRDRAEEIRYSRRLIFIASASSYHAAMAVYLYIFSLTYGKVRALFEELTGLPVNLELSSDFLDRSTIVGRNDTCIFISQSGETAGFFFI
jgi:glucosamine--fructose-6-phosphate aminotransferase (isomerizing)